MPCPQCFVGHCRTHPLQDHGKRKDGLLSQVKTLNSLQSTFVKDKLAKMQSKFGVHGTSDKDLAGHRRELEQDRRRAERKPQKSLTKEQREIAATALNGNTLLIMQKMLPENEDTEARRKRRKKKQLKKEKKRAKKEKKHKKKKARAHAKTSPSPSHDEQSAIEATAMDDRSGAEVDSIGVGKLVGKKWRRTDEDYEVSSDSESSSDSDGE